jgi:hypothetical protein
VPNAAADVFFLREREATLDQVPGGLSLKNGYELI